MSRPGNDKQQRQNASSYDDTDCVIPLLTPSELSHRSSVPRRARMLTFGPAIELVLGFGLYICHSECKLIELELLTTNGPLF